MKNMTPEQALAILMGLRSGDSETLQHVPSEEDLPNALTHLSDIACIVRPHLTVITDECNKAVQATPFLEDNLPTKEMAEFALHLVRCDSCRALLAARGIRPFDRSKLLLQQALGIIETEPKPAS